MPAKLRPMAAARQGEEYDVVPCPWDGLPAPVFTDKHGRPWAKCMSCGARMFGSVLAFEEGQRIGRVVPVVWPPQSYDGGQPVG